MDRRVGAVRLLVISFVVASVAACASLGPPPSPPAAAAGENAFLLAEGKGPGGPWSHWVWRSRCGLHQRVESALFPPPISIDSGPERCVGPDAGARPDGVVVERIGIGDEEAMVSFVYGQTRPDVVRVMVRTVDGREFEVETVAAPDELGVNSRFYVAPIPVGLFRIDTVRGYDASGQDVGGE